MKFIFAIFHMNTVNIQSQPPQTSSGGRDFLVLHFKRLGSVDLSF